ncbi:hypothetical protein ANCCEY_07794 [Ancylostoma ceylanicum]|uniref:Uncharacterized protein n=1 Tax=Ancylostoma ceylanicum TaxID=53326 RepID=A0A0D6LZP0_9BILA|nr:hypothetical protein ANCCEY_07794 [Ancylostoma ceylanicum]
MLSHHVGDTLTNRTMKIVCQVHAGFPLRFFRMVRGQNHLSVEVDVTAAMVKLN